MNQKILSLTPKRYFCPYCGEWHDWGLSHELGYYNSSSNKAELGCENQRSGYRHREMNVYFSDGYCYYKTVPICIGNLSIDDKILIEDIVESSEEPRITFAVSFTTSEDVGRSECRACRSANNCLMCKLSDENKSRHMHIRFGFEFKQSDYEKFSNAALLARKEKELQERENALRSKEGELQARENAFNQAKDCTQQNQQHKKVQEDTTMANIFNMNLEFGPNMDENIVSTLMGVAVKNGDSWRIFDKTKKEITDVGDMQLGNLPIFILPTTKLEEGDLIKDAGEYYFVMKVDTGSTQTLCAKTGEMKTIIPIKNVLGFSCYSKVIALSDLPNMGDDFDVEKLAIMSTMCGQTGETGVQMNQLLPLMLFKDKPGGDDDTMKLLFMSSMMTSEDDGVQMNQLLPLMLFKDKPGGDDDTMKLLFMSSMMGGNMASAMMSYMMFDALMGKKDDKDLQAV